MIIANTVVLIGAVLVNTLPESHPLSRLGAFYILFVNTIPFIMCMSLVSSNIGGFTKKTTVGVMIFMSYSVGQIVAPHFFLASESPAYPTGFRAFYVCVALMIAIEFGMIFYYFYENRKRIKEEQQVHQAPKPLPMISWIFQTRNIPSSDTSSDFHGVIKLERCDTYSSRIERNNGNLNRYFLNT
jgi:hypothetical protein